MTTKNHDSEEAPRIPVSAIDMEWHPEQGTCLFEGMPVAMMWVDSTRAGLMSGVQNMVGTDRFGLALQSEGRKSVDADWQVISNYNCFPDGFPAIANIAAVAGWGRWELVSLDETGRVGRFRAFDTWEGRYQKMLGVCWGSGMLAGKFAGYCSRLFQANCWAEQVAFIAAGDPYDEFVVQPSARSIEVEIENLLANDEATRADMAVALKKLEQEISDRRRAENAARESEERYSTIFDTVHDALFIHDTDGRILDANETVLKTHGVTRTEARGMNIATDFSGPGNPVEGLPSIWKRVSEGERVTFEWNARRPGDGSTFPAEVWLQRLTLGNSDYILANFRDITERKRSEEERLELERRLLHAQKLESLGVLAGGIAHDFNNLLMAILGNLDMALLDVEPSSPTQSHVEQALHAARRAVDLTRQMLAYSGKGRFKVTPLDLRDLVTENAGLFRSAISKTVCMEVSLSPEPVTIEADAGQVQQVIMNLITNAAEAIGEKAGTIRLTAGIMDCDNEYLGNSRLSEKPPAGRFAYLEVADTGCGMDAGTIERLFDPFFTTKFTGRGLGMSVVLGIVTAHKGALTVESSVGRGSTIRVFFPAFDGIGDTAASPVRPPATAGAGAKPRFILVVDDEETVRSVCAAFLGYLGFDCLGAADGEEALAIFKERADGLASVLLDLTMPRMDGLRTFRAMKEHRPDIPVILCSGYNEQDATRRFTAEGLADFLQKPYGLDDLRSALDLALAAPSPEAE